MIKELPPCPYMVAVSEDLSGKVDEIVAVMKECRGRFFSINTSGFKSGDPRRHNAAVTKGPGGEGMESFKIIATNIWFFEVYEDAMMFKLAFA